MTRARNSCIWQLIAIAVFSLLLGGCATVVRGGKQSVRIDSVPSGATIHLSNGITGVTPATLELSRKESVNVEFRKEGYETVVRGLVSMRSKTGAVVSGGNALIGGMIGGAIDQRSGASLDLVPNPLVVTLMLLIPPAEGLPGPADWRSLKVGMGRRAVRSVLGNPSAVSDATGDQIWSYASGGTVKFHGFFVESWSLPEMAGLPEAPACSKDDAKPNRQTPPGGDASPSGGAMEGDRPESGVTSGPPKP